jgi:hypothetical protein
MTEFKVIFKGIEFEMVYDNQPESYKSLLNKLFPEKTWIYKEEDCPGKWFAVGIDESGYWFHQGSFGTCCCCDVLESIDDEASAIEFLTIMNRLTPIGKSVDEAIAYLEQTKANVENRASDVIDKIIKMLRRGKHDKIYF